MNNGKFIIKDGSLVIEDTGEVIEDAEPVFILRGRDVQALATLRSYQATMKPTSKCWKGLQSVITDFTMFKLRNIEKMQPPETVY